MYPDSFHKKHPVRKQSCGSVAPLRAWFDACDYLVMFAGTKIIYNLVLCLKNKKKSS